MVKTYAVFKYDVTCRACGCRQYETILRVSQARPLTCVECRQNIDVPQEHPALFTQAVAFVEWERSHVAHSLSGGCQWKTLRGRPAAVRQSAFRRPSTTASP